MRTIKWELPFKNMHYLNALASDLADNPNVIIMTGIQSETGSIDRCQISLREDKEMDNTILMLGAAIGAHAVVYAQEMIEVQEEIEKAKQFLFKTLKGVMQEIVDAQEQNEQEAPFIPEEKLKEDIKNTDVIIQTDVDLQKVEDKQNKRMDIIAQNGNDGDHYAVVKEKPTLGIEEDIEVVDVIEVIDTPYRKFLRLILRRFKK